MTSADDWRTVVGTAARLQSELVEFASAPVEEPEEELAPVGSAPMAPEDTRLAAYDERLVDPDLRDATRSRYVSTHYADAVEAGVKCLNECVRTKSGRLEDGDALMTTVFSANNPILRINALRTKSDESEQRGHMLLCQGVISAWRNPRAHSNLSDDPEKALMMLETIQELILVTKGAVRARQRRSTAK